ncbi:MAG: hypothetical protein QXP01_02390 [Candidatus Hadarchaeum sp.]
MRPRSIKQKGRRLQVLVAEWLSRHTGLTIIATPPTRPGIRNEAIYVPEGEGDLLVRTMSQPGIDVFLASDKARAICRDVLGVDALGIECKNDERLVRSLFSFDLEDKVFAMVDGFFGRNQALTCISGNRLPLFLLWPSRQAPPWASIPCRSAVSGTIVGNGSAYAIVVLRRRCSCAASAC